MTHEVNVEKLLYFKFLCEFILRRKKRFFICKSKRCKSNIMKSLIMNHNEFCATIATTSHK